MTTHKCLLWTVASSLTSKAEAMLINIDPLLILSTEEEGGAEI